MVEMQLEWCVDGVFLVVGMYYFCDYGSYFEDLKCGEVVIIFDVEIDLCIVDSVDVLLVIGICLLINVFVIQVGCFFVVGFVYSDCWVEFFDEDVLFICMLVDWMQVVIQYKCMQEECNLLNCELIYWVKNMLVFVGVVVWQIFCGMDESGCVDVFLQWL